MDQVSKPDLSKHEARSLQNKWNLIPAYSNVQQRSYPGTANEFIEMRSLIG